MKACCKLVLKIYLFFFNIFLWLVAVGILGGVGYYFFTADQYKDLTTDNTIIVYTIVPLVLIVLVALMLLVLSVLGLISACFDVKILIAIYGFLLAIVVTVQVVGGVLVVIFRDPVLNSLTTGFEENIATYNESEGFRLAVDNIQRGLQCCGLNSSSDWDGIMSPPQSCCLTEDPCDTDDASEIFPTGCAARLTELIQQSTAISISVAVLLALIQYSGVFIAFILACCCRKDDSEDLIDAKRNLPNY